MEVFLAISSTIFLNDFVSVRLIFGKSKVTQETTFHHLIGLVGMLGALFIGRVSGPFVVSIFATEVSTPFLNFRSTMKDLELETKYPNLFYYNGICLMVSFFIVRVVLMGLLITFYIIPTIYSYDFASARVTHGQARVIAG